MGDYNDYVEGFIHAVGSLVEPKMFGNKYFNAQLQKKTQVSNIAGFRQKQNYELKVLENRGKELQYFSVESE